jgi:hypothetical protein
MYFSQTAIVLVLLVFLTSTIFYQTVEFKTNDVKNSMEIKKMALYEKNLENTLDRVDAKIVNDAFVNRSYEIMHGNRDFYNSANDAVKDIDDYIKNEVNKSLSILSDDNGTISYSIESINISPVSNMGDESPSYVNVHYEIYINYSKKLKNGYVVASKPLIIDKEVKLSDVPDPYVYRNKFYWTWTHKVSIDMPAFPDDKNHTFYIILNDNNFDYDKMNNPQSPAEIRIIGKKPDGDNTDYVLLPYWVQTWNSGNDHTSIIWVKCNEKNLISGDILYLIYGSSVTTDRQNPDKTFELFDDFNYMNYNKWNVSGGWYINDSILTVQGLGSSVWTNKTYGTGLELMFKGNFTPVHAQAVGFFTPKSDDDGVGWDCYDWSADWLYMRIGKQGNTDYGSYVPNGFNYLNNYYIYDLKRVSENELTFTIFDDTLNEKYIQTFDNGNKGDDYSISINTFENSDAKVSIDWIFLKDINDITPDDIGTDQPIPDPDMFYKELKPKTYIQTIYYGDPNQYIYVNDLTDKNAGNYSIIGLLTNATDSWGTCGYKPIIEMD